jgi:hypothetical protein
MVRHRAKGAAERQASPVAGESPGRLLIDRAAFLGLSTQRAQPCMVADEDEKADEEEQGEAAERQRGPAEGKTRRDDRREKGQETPIGDTIPASGERIALAGEALLALPIDGDRIRSVFGRELPCWGGFGHRHRYSWLSGCGVSCPYSSTTIRYRRDGGRWQRRCSSQGAGSRR